MKSAPSQPPIAVWLAYLYKRRNSETKDGWRERLTVSCDEHGHVSRYDYEMIRREGWIFIGHYRIGETPDNVWAPARVNRVKA